jgi:superfamily II DNA or RNA helicase
MKMQDTHVGNQLQSIIATTLAEARPYQERVIEKAHDSFVNTGVKSCMVESPTGSGKTVMGLLTARWLQEKLGIGVGWVAMRRNLLAQAARANTDLRLGLDEPCFLSMFDKNPPLYDTKERQIDLLVVDEAQHDAASSMAHLHNTIKPRFVLGLTATPFRTDSVKLCFDKVIKDAGIHALIGQGYLSQYHQYTIPEWNVDSVVDHYLRDTERWGKSVMFWHKREQADECLARLTANGVRAELVVADNDPKQERRERQIADFEKGKIDVLVNMYILTEGFDSPSLKTVWVRDSGKAPTMQMAGRVFRKYPDIEFKQVVQSKRTRWPIHRTAAPAEALIWMGDRWASYKANKNVAQVSTKTSVAMISIETVMPKYILNKKKEAGVPRRQGQRSADTESGLPRRNDADWRADDGWVGGFGGGAIIH